MFSTSTRWCGIMYYIQNVKYFELQNHAPAHGQGTERFIYIDDGTRHDVAASSITDTFPPRIRYNCPGKEGC